MNLNHHLFLLACFMLLATTSCKQTNNNSSRESNRPIYSGETLNRVAFPIGGIGAGMFCMEGTGAISEFSIRHQPDIFNEPYMLAAIHVKGIKNGTKVLEGQVPDWKVFGDPKTGNGAKGKTYGFPRFENASFEAKFPFGKVTLKDEDIPLNVEINGWSPFIPTEEDDSSLPVGGFEYTFQNSGQAEIEATFSYHSENMMRIGIPFEHGGRYEKGDSISGTQNGFVLKQSCFPDKPHYKGDFAIFSDDPGTVVDLCWFRGGWYDGPTSFWKDLTNSTYKAESATKNAKGASLYIPFKLKPGEAKTIRVMMCWYVPHSDLTRGLANTGNGQAKPVTAQCDPASGCCPDLSDKYYEPWYAGRFKSIEEVIKYWTKNYAELKDKSALFANTFYNSSLPPVVIDAVTANLSILKSPTVLRQKDGKLWGWEGCHDDLGCCPGSCTHVWNYAQSIPHLFPGLERSMRETEFNFNQGENGHQSFRASLPIKKEVSHLFHAAADGQLGGIMKVYREWRISGNTDWMKGLYPEVRKSLDYCIEEWDPKHKGIIEEPHHNTYDIEFWGPDGMHTSIYLGALQAIIKMGAVVGEDTTFYAELYTKGKQYLEEELYNGEYFIQKITTNGLRTNNPIVISLKGLNTNYSPEALELLQKEGPKYQYGDGCLSDGIIGAWFGSMSGLDDFIDPEKVKRHLIAVHQYNLRHDLTDHVNPQRPSYAVGKEGGLLLCSWPKKNELTLPFIYSNEVWTGIEYQVASHLMAIGEVEKGLDIVNKVRNRYNGKRRNPFNEYECGHWYARAMSSYGLLQGLTGVRYDAVDQTLYIDSKVGDFTSFLSTENGFGNVGLKNGEPFIAVVFGRINIKKVVVSGKEIHLDKLNVIANKPN